MDSIPLDGNIITHSMCNSMENMVENIMREPMNSVDFLICVVLLSLVIYLFSYIRRNK